MKALYRLLVAFGTWAKRNTRTFFWGVVAVCISLGLMFAGGKAYQHLDRDKDRGAVEIGGGAFGEDYTTPVYLDQGWANSDSLWFYNTTQGSNLLPYDLFLHLEMPDSERLLRSDAVMDEFRYLPQKKTFFNPDALPVGFVKDEYQGDHYVGLTCAACHTGQVNYKGKAIRIDGGPGMADMTSFLKALEKGLYATISDETKRERFVSRVLDEGNDYSNESQVLDDLALWADIRRQYNVINHSNVEYGYARMDAFGRIFNRVLQYVINSEQLASSLSTARRGTGDLILSPVEVAKVLDGIEGTVISRDNFLLVVDRLRSDAEGLPGLGVEDILHIRNHIFNEPNAPVSYPFLWDTAHADYVQWNGIASNAGPGALGRNVGEVTGVFASIDWSEAEPGWSISALASGQEHKRKRIKFTSSVDLVNLERLEAHLGLLTSPKWNEELLEKIDHSKLELGGRIYAEYCQSCHELVESNDWDRKVVAQMSALDEVGTDPAMAMNSVRSLGNAGNFKHTYQKRDVGNIIIPEKAPVAVILTSAVSGLVATPDADKNIIRRRLDWLYLMGLSFFKNDIKESVKSGSYTPDTTAQPFNSLVAYKARSLNGIWATAPYLHNGSVPTLYDLLLPVKREGDPEDGEYRPEEFLVGSREFDPVKVGFKSEGYDGFVFKAQGRGNLNSGHEYAAGRTARSDGKTLPPLSEEERWALLEFVKTL